MYCENKGIKPSGVATLLRLTADEVGKEITIQWKIADMNSHKLNRISN